jgi:hypothetical protein
MRNAYKIVGVKPDKETKLGRPRPRRVDAIKMDLG